MNPKFKRTLMTAACACLLTGAAGPLSAASVFSQCPGDNDADSVPDVANPDVVCMHLTGGDGFVTMADGKELYMFGFADLTGTKDDKVISDGTLAANFPAPNIVLEEGQEFYLTLTNVGMLIRPDLFDPHTVHFHGFPNASAIFDGLPDTTISINMGASLSYYYNLRDPGTYMYHCHVEATEHMQMGMLGNLYVKAGQNKTTPGTNLNGYVHQSGDTYAYNDGDGSTRYDVEAALQIGSFDGAFHDASETVQPLPFAEMWDNYPMLNGRGYPDTVELNPLPAPAGNGGIQSQPVTSLVQADVGDKVLLRISNLNVTNFYSLTLLGMPMEVVGMGAKQLKSRASNGKKSYYQTNNITLGGGEAIDVLLDTSGVEPGTYFLYSSNLNFLSNDQEDFGGMMTEIRISAP